MPDEPSDDEAPREPEPPFLQRPAQDLSPKPAGWQDPHSLLAELLYAFGYRQPPDVNDGRKGARLAAGGPVDFQEQTALFGRELASVAPLLVELLGGVRGMRGIREELRAGDWTPPVLGKRPRAVDPKLKVRERWNQELQDGGCKMLSYLCDWCATPVFRRYGLQGGGPARFCSEACQNRDKALKYYEAPDGGAAKRRGKMLAKKRMEAKRRK